MTVQMQQYLINKNFKVNFIDKMLIAKKIEFYEYYDGIHITCDDKHKYKYTSDDELQVYETIYIFVQKYLKQLTDLEILEYTSRFPEEMNYKFIKGVPKSLKTLYIEHTTGLKFKALPDNLKLYVFTPNERQLKTIKNEDVIAEPYDYIFKISVKTKRITRSIPVDDFSLH